MDDMRREGFKHGHGLDGALNRHRLVHVIGWGKRGHRARLVGVVGELGQRQGYRRKQHRPHIRSRGATESEDGDLGLVLLLVHGQPLLGLVSNAALDQRIQSKHAVEGVCCQHTHQHLLAGHHGGGTRSVEQDADLAKERARGQLCVHRLTVSGGDTHGTLQDPVHGQCRVALLNDVLLRVVLHELELGSHLGVKRLGGVLEEGKRHELVEEGGGDCLQRVRGVRIGVTVLERAAVVVEVLRERRQRQRRHRLLSGRIGSLVQLLGHGQRRRARWLELSGGQFHGAV